MISSKIRFTFFILLIFNSVMFAQNNEPSSSDNILVKIQEKKAGQGDVVVFQDMRINDLIYNHVEHNKRSGGIPGYRIRIFSDLGSNAREKAQLAKAKFYEYFSEIPIYLVYHSPYFNIYVGDFRTNVDAMKEFKRIKRYFPAAFIVPDKINYPSLDE